MGIWLVEGPDADHEFEIAGDTPTEEERRRADKILRGFYPELYRKKDLEESRTAGDWVEESAKGVARGAINLGSTAARGAGIDEWADDLRELSDSDALRRSEAFEDSTAIDLAEGVGSALPFLATGSAGLVGRGAAFILGGLAGSGEQAERIDEYEKATGQEVSMQREALARALGFGIGLTEALPINRILGRVSKNIPKSAKDMVFNGIRDVLQGAGEEGFQEGFSQLLQNWTEMGLYNSDLEWHDSLASSLGLGAGVGGIMAGAVETVSLPVRVRRARQKERELRAAKSKEDEKHAEALQTEINLSNNARVLDPINFTPMQNETPQEYATRQAGVFQGDDRVLFPQGPYNISPRDDGSFDIVTKQGIIMGAPAQSEQEAAARIGVYSQFAIDARAEAEAKSRPDTSTAAKPKITSPKQVHDLMNSRNIAWDNDPDFMDWTKAVVGKEHLDDMTSDELSYIHDILDVLPEQSEMTSFGNVYNTLKATLELNQDPDPETASGRDKFLKFVGLKNSLPDEAPSTVEGDIAQASAAEGQSLTQKTADILSSNQTNAGNLEARLSAAKDPTKPVEWYDGDTDIDEINGVKMTPVDDPGDWTKVAGTKPNLSEPPVPQIRGKKNSAGIVFVEPDGRIWVVEPTNHFGGYRNTFPKGRIEQGLNSQQTALKEAWEESGLTGEITDYLGDYEGDTTTTRYYLAKRTGGHPSKSGWESQGVKLVPPSEAEALLNKSRDKQILRDLRAKIAKQGTPAQDGRKLSLPPEEAASRERLKETLERTQRPDVTHIPSDEIVRDAPQIEAELQKHATKTGGSGVNLRLAKNLFSSGTKNLRGAQGAQAGKIIAASLAHTDPMASPKERQEALLPVINHETVHWLEEQDKFKPSEWNGLIKYAKRTKKPGTNRSIYEDVRARYSQNGARQVPDHLIDSEAVAHVFELATKGSIKLTGGPAAQYNQVRGLFGAIGNALRNRGHDNVSKVFRKFESGEIASRSDKVRSFRLLNQLGYVPKSLEIKGYVDEEKRDQAVGADTVSRRNSLPASSVRYSLPSSYDMDSVEAFLSGLEDEISAASVYEIGVVDINGDLVDPDTFTKKAREALKLLSDPIGEAFHNDEDITPDLLVAALQSAGPIFEDLGIDVSYVANKSGLGDLFGATPSTLHPHAEALSNNLSPVEEADRPTKMPHHIDQLIPIPNSGQGGSNAGWFFEDINGYKYYVKSPKDPKQAFAEVIASKFYKALGINVADVSYIDLGDGYTFPSGASAPSSLGIVSHIEKLSNNKHKYMPSVGGEAFKNPATLQQAQAGFVVDAWLANWDAVGLNYDNMLVDGEGNVLRIDTGGSLMYRAQGALKDLNPDVVGELTSLRDPSINPQAADVYGSITEEQLSHTAQAIAMLSDEDIVDIVRRWGPMGQDPARIKGVFEPGDMPKWSHDLERRLISRKRALRDQLSLPNLSEYMPRFGANIVSWKSVSEIGARWRDEHNEAWSVYSNEYQGPSDDRALNRYIENNPETWQKSLNFLHENLRKIAPSGKLLVWRNPGSIGSQATAIAGPERAGGPWRFSANFPFASTSVSSKFGSGGITGGWPAIVNVEDVIGVGNPYSFESEEEITVRRDGLSPTPFVTHGTIEFGDSDVTPEKAQKALEYGANTARNLPFLQPMVALNETSREDNVVDWEAPLSHFESTMQVSHKGARGRGNEWHYYDGSQFTAQYRENTPQRAINFAAADTIKGAKEHGLPFVHISERVSDKEIREKYLETNELDNYVRPGIDFSFATMKGTDAKEMQRLFGRLMAGLQREAEVSLFDQWNGEEGVINAARIVWMPEIHTPTLELLKLETMQDMENYVRTRQRNFHKKIIGLTRAAMTQASQVGTIYIPDHLTKKEINEFWDMAWKLGDEGADGGFTAHKNPFRYLQNLVEEGQKEGRRSFAVHMGRKSSMTHYYDSITAGRGDYDATEKYLRGAFKPEDFTTVIGTDGEVQAPFANEAHAAWRRPISQSILRRLLHDDGTWGRELTEANRQRVREHALKLWNTYYQPFQHQADSKLNHVATYSSRFADQAEAILDMAKMDADVLKEELKEWSVTDPDTGRKWSLPDDPDLPPEANATMNKVFPPTVERTFGQTIIETITDRENYLTRLRQKFIDRYASIARNSRLVAKYVGEDWAAMADYSAAAAAYLSDRARGVFASALKAGVPVYVNGHFKVATEINGQKMPGLLDILKPLYNNRHNKNLVRQWATYSVAMREERFDAEGRPVLTTPSERQAAREIALVYPEIAAVHDAYQSWNRYLVQMMKDAGVIDQEAADLWTKHGDYFPFYRQMEGDEVSGPANVLGGIANVDAPKRAKGSSERTIGDPLENLARNAQAAITASMKTVAMQRAMRDGVALGQVVDLTDMVERGEMTATQALKNKTHSYRLDGKTRYVEIYDPALFEAVASINEGKLFGIEFLGKPAELLREMVTRDPGFMLANMLRDTASVWVTSGANIIPVIDTFRNFGKETKDIFMNKGDQNPLALGGIIGGYDFSQDPKNIKKWMQKELKKRKAIKRTAWDQFVRVWDAAGNLTTASDAATRMAVYNDVLKRTGNEAEALFQALEVINFSRRGSANVVRWFTAGIPFLNARIQGLDVLYRAAIGQYSAKHVNNRSAAMMGFLLRSAVMVGTSMAYFTMVNDDEDYIGAAMSDVDDYYIIPIGGGREPLRIPIPFEIGVLFKVFPERIARYFLGTDTSRDTKASIMRAIMQTLEINPFGIQATQPFMEAATNYSYFRGQEIVPYFMSGKDFNPAMQYRSTTSSTAKLLAQGIDSIMRETGMATPGGQEMSTLRSPMKMEHLIKGYTGTIGTYLLDVTDALVRGVEGAPERPGRKLSQWPVFRRFVQDNTGSGYLEQFYDLRNAVREVAGTLRVMENELNFEEYQDFVNEYGWLLQMDSLISTIDGELRQHRQMIDMIFRDPNMDADEKRASLDNILQARSDMLKFMPGLRKTLFEDMKDEYESAQKKARR